MKYFIFPIIFRIFTFLCLGFVFAQGVYADQCTSLGNIPDIYSASFQADMSSDIGASIKKCDDIHTSGGNPLSITDFYCPPNGAQVVDADGRPLDIKYMIAVDRLFTRIDQEVNGYMHSLQQCRNKDMVAWSTDLQSKFELTSVGPTYGKDYTNVCSVSYISTLLMNAGYPVIQTDEYPQTICQTKANQKITAWINMGNMLMKSGIEKSYQNDKDVFISQVKGAYKRVIDKFNTYFGAITRAFPKINFYIKNPVK